MKKAILMMLAVVAISACQPKNLDVVLPDGNMLNVLFYPGNSFNKVEDLMIIDGKTYFGKASYARNDPLGDVSFRMKNSQRVRAECSNSIMQYGKEKCAEYEVYNSSFPLLPVGSIFNLDK